MSSKRRLQNRKPNPAERNKAKAVVYRQRHSLAFVDCAAVFCNDENTILPKNFPVFRHEHPRLSSRFTDTFDLTYDACSYMDQCFALWGRFEGYKRLAILTRTRYNNIQHYQTL